MKRFLILISAVALISCNVQVDKPEIIDEQYNPTDEQRLWANDKVALEYVNDEYFHMEPGTTSTSYFEHSLLLYSKSRYPIFEDLVKGLSRQYDEYKSESRNSSLNSL